MDSSSGGDSKPPGLAPTSALAEIRFRAARFRRQYPSHRRSSSVLASRRQRPQTLPPALRKTHCPVRHPGGAARRGLRHRPHLDPQLDAGRKDLADRAGVLSVAGADAGAARPDCPAAADPDQRGRRSARGGLFLSRPRRRSQRRHGRTGAGDQCARRHPDRAASAVDRSDRAVAPRGRGDRHAAVHLRSSSRVCGW